MLCNKLCNWNKTHTAGFFCKYKVNTSNFLSQLSTTHPYCHIIKDHIPDMNPQPPPYQVPPYTRTNASPLTSTEDQMVINKCKCKYVMESHDHT